MCTYMNVHTYKLMSFDGFVWHQKLDHANKLLTVLISNIFILQANFLKIENSVKLLLNHTYNTKYFYSVFLQ